MQWQNGRRGQDSWNRWTRRRKWYRDAELVEVDADDAVTPDSSETTTSTPTQSSQQSAAKARSASPAPSHAGSTAFSAFWTGVNGATEKKKGGDAGGGVDHDEVDTDAISLMSTASRSRRNAPFLRRRMTDTSVRGVAAPAVTTAATAMAMSGSSRRDGDGMGEEDAAMLSSSAGVKLHEPRVGSWGIGDEAQMSLE